MTDPLQIVADLRPAQLDRIAEDAYARRRATDLARALGEAGAGSPRVARRGHRHARRWPLLTGAGVLSAAAAVTAIALTGALAGPAAPARPAGAAASAVPAPGAAKLDARTFLLASANVAGQAPAGPGSYWYVKERDFEPTWQAPPKMPAPRWNKKGLKPVLPPAKDPGYAAYYAATEESWTGQAKARTIVNEDLQFGFRSAADQARWAALGKPKLFNPTGGYGYNGTRTSDYSMTFYFGYGVHRVSVDQARKLPATPEALNKLLRQWWNSEPDKQGAVGPVNPNFGQYVFTWAGALLAGPVTQGTKAALYRLLAAQPGIQVAPGVTDPLGRTGVLASDGTRMSLLIDPGTASLLATTTASVHAGQKVPAASGGTEAIIQAGWATRPGVLPS